MGTLTDRYAVMGNPIAHSKSPEIHRLFAEQTHQHLSYEAILVDTDRFAESVEAFAQHGGKGLNITVPFKQQAWELSTELSQRAELAGAVNTISISNNRLIGDNTDGAGLVRDLEVNCDTPMKDLRILVVGAGGAVRGVLSPILEKQPASVIIANRTHMKALELARQFKDYGDIAATEFGHLPEEPFDLIINGTAASLQGDIPPVPDRCVGAQTTLYDMMYGSEPSRFTQWGTRLGAKASLDGLGMLVEQAAESFFIWRQVRPDTRVVIGRLRAKMSS